MQSRLVEGYWFTFNTSNETDGSIDVVLKEICDFEQKAMPHAINSYEEVMAFYDARDQEARTIEKEEADAHIKKFKENYERFQGIVQKMGKLPAATDTSDDGTTSVTISE